MKLIHRLLEATDEFGCVPEAMHRRFCLFSMKDFAAFLVVQSKIHLQARSKFRWKWKKRLSAIRWKGLVDFIGFLRSNSMKIECSPLRFWGSAPEDYKRSVARWDNAPSEHNKSRTFVALPKVCELCILLSQQFSSKTFPWLLVLGGFEERPIGSTAGRLVRSSLKWLAAKQPDCGVPICFKKKCVCAIALALRHAASLKLPANGWTSDNWCSSHQVLETFDSTWHRNDWEVLPLLLTL